MKNPWIFVAAIVILFAIMLDESRAGSYERAHNACVGDGQIAFTTAELRDAGVPLEDVLAMTKDETLLEVIRTVYDSPSATPQEVGTFIYSVCMEQLVEDV